MPGALHIVTARLRPDAPADGLTHAVEAARALSNAPGAEDVLIGLDSERLVVATWLAGREALDAFAESRQHMAFVMRGLAPVIRGMWSAAVEAEAAHPPADTSALWVFAVPEREGIYEWQVRDFLSAVETLPGASAAGPTVEERERYRASGVVCVRPAERAAFDAALVVARQQWAEVAGGLEEATVPVLPA